MLSDCVPSKNGTDVLRSIHTRFGNEAHVATEHEVGVVLIKTFTGGRTLFASAVKDVVYVPRNFSWLPWLL